MIYQAIYRWSDERDAFIAEATDYPDCTAEGGSLEELRDYLRSAIRDRIKKASGLSRATPAPSEAHEVELCLVRAAPPLIPPLREK